MFSLKRCLCGFSEIVKNKNGDFTRITKTASLSYEVFMGSIGIGGFKIMNYDALQEYDNPEFQAIRSLTIDGTPWFIGQDIARNLEYQNGSRDIARYVDEEDRMVVQIYDGHQNRNVMAINESGMYALILGSRMEKARRFKHWVTADVLPSIRKNRGYIRDQENMSPEQIVANALIVAQNIIDSQKEQIEAMTPKAEFYDAVADSGSAMSMERVAKVLGIRGYGQNNLFRFLREQRILNEYNVPHQKYMEYGWFKLIEQKYERHEKVMVTTKTLVTQKGVEAIRKKIIEHEAKKGGEK